ncbi:solute carrier family 10 member 6-like [Acanthaster planci]|uniref:Solute carrier family 10 member 6-like n=1 Tax=Acanthaster planci TaxID=133434 RepID=A0A8B7Z7F2_ACAPL|nr:solute carrier family 10 member 6-like [Acanthaster planci]
MASLQVEASPEEDAVIKLQRTFLLVTLGLSSLIYGSKVDPLDFTRGVKKPKAMWMSMFVSVLLSPVLAYVLILALRLEVREGIALLVTSCCPAGNLSPIFTYYTEADICLSLSVIVLSTLMSVGMIPLGVYICSNAYTELDLTVIPNTLIVVNLCVNIGGIALGMAFRRYKEKWADRFVKAVSYLPLLVVIAMIIIVRIKLPNSVDASIKDISAVFLYLIIVLCGTYLTGMLVDQDHHVCRAMGLCSADKSVALALSIIHVSFSGEALVDTLTIPTLFLIEYILIGVVLSVAYQIYSYHTFSPFTVILENLRPVTPV